MPQNCCVYECGKTSEQYPGLSFHQFPSNKKAWRKWEDRVSRKNWKPTKHSHVCSEHFLPSDICPPNPDTPDVFRKTRLKRGAVPSLKLRGKLERTKSDKERTTKTAQGARPVEATTSVGTLEGEKANKENAMKSKQHPQSIQTIYFVCDISLPESPVIHPPESQVLHPPKFPVIDPSEFMDTKKKVIEDDLQSLEWLSSQRSTIDFPH